MFDERAVTANYQAPTAVEMGLGLRVDRFAARNCVKVLNDSLALEQSAASNVSHIQGTDAGLTSWTGRPSMTHSM